MQPVKAGLTDTNSKDLCERSQFWTMAVEGVGSSHGRPPATIVCGCKCLVRACGCTKRAMEHQSLKAAATNQTLSLSSSFGLFLVVVEGDCADSQLAHRPTCGQHAGCVNCNPRLSCHSSLNDCSQTSTKAIHVGVHSKHTYNHKIANKAACGDGSKIASKAPQLQRRGERPTKETPQYKQAQHERICTHCPLQSNRARINTQ
eukprot:NODE_2898_length_973_cov_277.697400_g2878_i0.p1 GENE.NODE_2898_length_973_cov_277.697400_g2878_i0~~NODE_2898_length_973_cov_277.697400_g2878_i0.p1  ORF type:complete len:203 (+),score=7.96 NODE_2898_length_973_cov_277.697400_g2878_i0:244-852(+)